MAFKTRSAATSAVGFAGIVAVMGLLLAGPLSAAKDKKHHPREEPFKKATVIIETTDNDIELQLFVDGVGWRYLSVEDPRGRDILLLGTLGGLRKQGLSEMHLDSDPSHFPVDEDGEILDPADTIAAFLRRFPAGDYEVDGLVSNGLELTGVATLTHVLPALPVIISPVSETDDLPVVDLNNAVIAWLPVTTQYFGEPGVQIIEYEVIIEQVEPFRKASIILDGSATSLKIPPEFLEPGQLYDYELVATEISGNATISVGEFMTE